VPGLPRLWAEGPESKMSRQNVKAKLAIAQNNTQGKFKGN